MKKHFLLLLITILFQQLVVAQIQLPSTTDSLFAVIKIEKENISKVNAMNALAAEFRNNNPDTAIYFARTASMLAAKLDFKKGVADANLWMGYSKMNLGEYEVALKYGNDALKMYDQLLIVTKTKDTAEILKQKANTLNCCGLVYYNQSYYPQALNIALSALKIRLAINDKQGIAASYNNIGNIYKSQGIYPEALKNYLACLKIVEEIGYKKGIAIASNHIGSFYHHHGNDTEALKNHLRALQLFEEIKDQKGIADSYIYIGNIYYYQNKYSEALRNYTASLKMYERMGDKEGIADGYNNIAGVFEGEANYNEALKNYFAALKIREELDDKQGVALVCNNLGLIYMQQRKTKDAHEYLNKALTLAKEISSLDDMKESYHGLTRLDSAEGNFKQALEHYKLYIALRDSLYNEENTKKTVQAQMQFDFDKKESLVKAQQEKRDLIAKKELQEQHLIIKQKNTWLFLLLMGLVSIVLISFLVYRNNRQKHIIQSKRIKELEQEKQLLAIDNIMKVQEAERARMAKDLHDGLGGMLSGIKLNLSSMKGNVVVHEKDATIFSKSIKQLDNAIAEMRRVAHNMMPEALLKFGLTEAIRDYCDNINEGKKIKVKFTSLGEITFKEKSTEVSLYRIMQELTNNAIKHAAAKNIFIQLTKHERGITFTVEDDGKGFNTKQLENIKGAGMQNVHSRVDYLKGNLEIQSSPGKGTSVIIEIPV